MVEQDFDDDCEDTEPQDIYEPTEEELDDYYRDKAERYWRNKW